MFLLQAPVLRAQSAQIDAAIQEVQLATPNLKRLQYVPVL
jgi:hypothetical protein